MQNLTRSFTMRRDGVLPRGDWFKFVENKAEPTKVYIYDEIGFWGTEASEFVKQLGDISGDFELHLNSPGGEIFDGLAIYNAIKQHKGKVTVFVDGLAASAASFIAQAGDEVIMARNAQMMIHDGIAFAYGNEQDMLDTAKLLSQLSDNIADIYAQAAKRRANETELEGFRALMREEVWYNGLEAVNAGLADSVLDHDDEEAENAKNKWDLSFYNHAGRDRAESPTRIAARLMLSNNAKENGMGNEETSQGTPDESGTPTGDPNEPGVTVVPDGDPTPPAEVVTADQPETAAPQPTAKVETAPENKAQGVMINGKLETDWSVINQHFNALNAAQVEQRELNRKNFVEALASDGKILASQVDHLITLVNGSGAQAALSDEQYAAFMASFESLPASPLFQKHDATSSTSTGAGISNTPKAAGEASKQRILDLQSTLAMHERAGLTQDEIKKTKSYVELQSLLGNNES